MNVLSGIIIFAGCIIFLGSFYTFVNGDSSRTGTSRPSRKPTNTRPTQPSTYSSNPARWHGSQTIIVPPELWHGTSEDNAIDIYSNNRCLAYQQTAPHGLWMADFNTAVSYAKSRGNKKGAVVRFDTSRITPSMAVEYKSIRHIIDDHMSEYIRQRNFCFIVMDNYSVWILAIPASNGNQYYTLDVISPVGVYDVHKRRIY